MKRTAAARGERQRMKAEKKASKRIPAWLTDPRLERPLLILVVFLSLFLAGLILIPSAKNYVNYLNLACRDDELASADAFI